MKKYYTLISIVLIAFFAYYSIFIHKRIYKKDAFYMDTIIEIQIYYHGPINVSKIANEALDNFRLIDSLCGYASKNGDIFNLNLRKRGEVSVYTKDIIDSSFVIGMETNDYFDITVGPILEQWKHFNEPLKSLPDSNTIRALLKFVNYKKIITRGDSAFLPDSASIDLGGIAKGYAIDLAYKTLKKHNLDAFLINAGGDIRVYSKGKKKWTIGIQNPRKNSVIGYFKIKNGAVVTSGDYERYVIINGIRYSHLINPKTGFPERRFASVTVFSSNATRADAMATAISVMGTKATEFVRNKNIRAILISTKDDSLVIWESDTLKKNIVYEKGFIPKTIDR
ncbi:FAD:protein FMN transferase [candidate division WOR-3 bacterium]|nr:FAD:protein FMN transferase [candidate division WOR-3 bacterium]